MATIKYQTMYYNVAYSVVNLSSVLPTRKEALAEVYIHALAGNRALASRVTGEHCTTEPPMRHEQKLRVWFSLTAMDDGTPRIRFPYSSF